MNSIQGVSTYAIRQGFLDAGIMDGDVLIFSELMDSRSLFLTANADTVYFLGRSSTSPTARSSWRPPPTRLGIVDDMWFRWITDFGLPGADRGQGGTYLLLPPGYDGPLPEGGFYVRHSRHQPRAPARPGVHQPEPRQRPRSDRRPDQGAAEDLPLRRRRGGQQYRRLPDRVRVRSASWPRRAALGSWRGPGWRCNTVPPNDFGHYEMLDALVQLEPAEALDTELAGQFAAIGIVKGEKFAPDARLRDDPRRGRGRR